MRLLLALAAATAVAALGASSASGTFLDQCPCAPTDSNLYAAFVYEETAPMAPAADPGVGAAELPSRVRAELERLLETEPPEVAARALALLDDPLAVAKVPDVRLRGALALLVGTMAEPAVAAILDDSVQTVGFEDLPLVPFLPGRDPVPIFAIALSLTGPNAGKQAILVNRRYQHEPFALLAPLLVHEALHLGDQLDGRSEEVAAALLGNTFVTAELLAEHPELADQSTEYTRWLLTFLLGLLFNSETPLQARGPEGLAPGSDLALPGLYPVWYPPQETPTPGRPLLRELLRVYGLEDAASLGFSPELLAKMDIDRMRRTFLSDDDLRRLGSEVLQLDLDVTAVGRIVRVTRAGKRLVVRLEAGEPLTVQAALARGSRVVSKASKTLQPGAGTVTLRLARGVAGRHVLRLELTDRYDNAVRLRRTVRLAAS